MKTIGIIAVIFGVIWGVITYESSPSMEHGVFGYLAEAESRENNLFYAGILALVGVILIGLGSGERKIETAKNLTRKCPYCAESIQDEAVHCRHCHKDIDTLRPPKSAEEFSFRQSEEFSLSQSSEPWKCQKCGETHGAQYNLCWNCGHEKSM